MRVLPLRNCLAGKYYTEGVEDDYEGPPNRHLEPVDKDEKAKWAKATAPKPKPGTAPAPAAAPKPAPVPAPKPAVDLNTLTKAEIVEHAEKVHGLDLDPSHTKDELIDQVKKAEKNS